MMNEKEKAQNVEPAQPAAKHELAELQELIGKFGREAAVVAAVVLCVVAGILWYQRHVRATAQRASSMLTAAKTAKDFEAVVEEFGSTAVGPMAQLGLAKKHFDSGNYDLALAKYEEFKTKYPNDEWSAGAELGRLHCLEAKGQLAEADQGFVAFVAAHPDHFLTPEATLAHGRCLDKLGKFDEARAVYEEFMAAHPKSAWLSRAEEMLADAKRKHKAADVAPAVPKEAPGATNRTEKAP
jgi:TolA-binding protein